MICRFVCRFEQMEHASTQAALDYMKKLAGVSYDFELAEKLGYSKQALSSVKKRQRIPVKWFAKASILFRVPIEELQAAGQLAKTSNAYQERPDTVLLSEQKREQDLLSNERRLFEEEKRRFWEERKELLAENRQLHREKEELLRENGELKAMVARLEERKNRLSVSPDQPAQNSSVA